MKRTFTSLLLLLLILFISGFVALQFKSVRQSIIGYGISQVQPDLNAKLSVDDFKLRGFYSLDLKDVLLTLEKDTIVYVPELYVDLNLKEILDGKIFLNKGILTNPDIRMTMGSDGEWSLAKIPKKSDGPPSDADVMVKLNNISIVNGKIRIFDSTSTHNSDKIDPTNLLLDSLNIYGDVFIRPKYDRLVGNFSTFTFQDTISNSIINEGEISFDLSKNYADLKKLKISHNKFSLDAKAFAKGLNVLKSPGEEELNKADMRAQFDLKNVNFTEFSEFFSIPRKFGGSGEIKASVSGNLKKLVIDDFKLNTGRTYLDIDGEIINITSDIGFDLNVRDGSIYQDDLQRFLLIDNPSFPYFNIASINSLNMKGVPKDLRFKMNLITASGNLIGDLKLDQRNNFTLKYSGKVSNLNIGKIIKYKSLNTNLNAKTDITGIGTDASNMNFDLIFNGQNSRILDYNFNKLDTKLHIDDYKKIQLDTLFAGFGKGIYDLDIDDEKNTSYLTAKGKLDLRDEIKTNYNLDIKYEALNLEKILGIEKLPKYLSGESSLNGVGLEPDSIRGEFKNSINEILFNDRAFFPFNVSFKIDKYPPDSRLIALESDFADFTLEGDYDFNTLISSLKNQGFYLFNFISERINTVIPEEQGVLKEIKLLPVPKIGAFQSLDANFKAKIKDLSFVSIFTDSLEVDLDSDINFHLYADSVESSLYINKLMVNDFYIKNKDQEYFSNSLDVDGGLYLKLVDSVPTFTDFDLALNSSSDINLNTLKLDKPLLKIEYKDELFNFNGSTVINEELGINFFGHTKIISNGLELEIDELDLKYKDEYSLSVQEKLSANFIDGGFDIKSLKLFNPNSKESVELTGKFDSRINELQNINLVLNDLYLNNLSPFIPKKNRENFNQIQGKVDSLHIIINGSTDNPEINTYTEATEFKVNNQIVGNVRSQLNYSNKNISGKFFIDHFQKKDLRDLLNVEVNTLPIDLSFRSVKERMISDREVEIKAKLDSMPMSALSPFVPAVSYLKGIADGELNIGGYLVNDLEFLGKIALDQASFLVDATNISYKADADLKFDDKLVTIENFNLYNKRQDLTRGKAKVDGEIELKNLLPYKFNLNFYTNRFLVLNDDSKKTMENVYGPLIISTEDKKLNFSGTLDKPELNGYISIEKASLKMPQEDDIQIVRSKFEYIRKEKLVSAEYRLAKDTSKTKKIRQVREKSESLMERLNIDLDIEFTGVTNIDMTINRFISTSVNVGTPISINTVRYLKTRDSESAKLFGKIVLKEGSKLSFVKNFDISGEISFPAGEIGNPVLDLKAEYKGRTSGGDRFTVDISVTGPKENPNIRFDYTINGESAIGDQNKIQKDVLSLLLFNRLSENSGFAENNGGEDQGLQNVIASEILTRQLSQVFSEYGLSASVEIQDDFDNARVKIGGNLIGGATWSFGGDVRDISGSEFEIEIPLDDFIALSSDEILNIILQFTYVNSPENRTITEEQIHWEGKLKLGGSW